MATKRKRNDLSLSDKCLVLSLLDQKLSQSAIAKKVGCSQSQVSRISSKKTEVRSLYEANGDPKRKRQRTGKAPDVESALLDWYASARTRGVPISGPILAEKAKELAKDLGIDDFNPSNGWLTRWKERNSISHKKVRVKQENVETTPANHRIENPVMALKGIRVVEMAGLAPAPFCGLILADFGANVIKVNRTPIGSIALQDMLTRGKRSIAVDMKKPEGVDLIRKLCKKADVLIEPFRKGVMEKNGLGPDVLLGDNPGLIYARITGYGQDGPLSTRAGHDINYLAISGVLSMLGGKSDKPQPPINLLGDFAGGGLIGALGIALALFERSKSGQGQIIDANMVEGASYIGSFLGHSRSALWSQPRGTNLLDGGMAFYDTYKTKDGKFVSVGAIEPQFFNKLVIGLGLNPDDISQFSDQDAMRKQFSEIFASKTRDEWEVIFKDVDACVAPILEWDEAQTHPHNKERKFFLKNPSGYLEPGPAPRLSRTPATNKSLPCPSIGQQTTEVLQEIGYSQSEIQQLISKEVVEQMSLDSKL